MRNINKVILIGNLTRDPEMRSTQNGQYITTFGLATNREWMTKDGRKQQSSEFHELVCWGKLAEIAHQYLKMGKLVYGEGYLKTRSWDDATGVKRFRTEIVLEDLIMLEKREKSLAPGSEKENEFLPSDETLSPASNKKIQPSISVEDPLTL